MENLVRVYTDQHQHVFIINEDVMKYYEHRILPHDIVAIVLRYNSIINYLRQSCTCPDIYTTVINIYGLEIEGFSSPGTFQMCKYNEYGYFCSPFPDTDMVAGSLGSIWSQDFVGKNVSIFPPPTMLSEARIINFLEDTLKRAEEQNKPTRFFILARYNHVDIGKSKYLRKKLRFPPNELYTVESNSDNYFLTIFESYLCVLDWGYENHTYDLLDNMVSRIKVVCDTISLIKKASMDYKPHKDYLDFSGFLSTFNFRSVKHFVMYMIKAGNIPSDIIDEINSLGYSRVYVIQQIIMNAIVKLNTGKTLRFSWDDIKQEVQLFVYEFMRE